MVGDGLQQQSAKGRDDLGVIAVGMEEVNLLARALWVAHEAFSAVAFVSRVVGRRNPGEVGGELSGRSGRMVMDESFSVRPRPLRRLR